MTGRLLTVLILAVLTVPASADRNGSVTRVDLMVPGKLVDFTLQDSGNGLKTVWLLVDPHPENSEEKQEPSDEKGEKKQEILPDCPASDLNRAPRKLFRVDPTGDGELVEVRSDLPWNGSSIEFADLHGDGRETLLLIVPKKDNDPEPDDTPPGLYGWEGDPASGDGRWLPLLAEPFLVWDRNRPGRVAASAIGELKLYRFDPDRNRFILDTRFPLPMETSVRRDRIRLSARTVEPIGSQGTGVAYITSPEPFGKTRLRTTAIHPDAAEEDRVVESWARLPEPEDLLDADYLVLDDRPVLVVQTKAGEKLAIFGEKRVRMYRLDLDRSRTGFPPFMAAETGMNLWQDGRPWILDVNRDGISDLVLGYWKGMKNDRVVLEVYLGNEDGSFREKPETTAFDVKDGDRSYVAYGQDLNGDGLFDLLVSDNERLMLFPGIPSRKGRKVVDGDPVTLLRTTDRDQHREESYTITVGSDGANAVRTSRLSLEPKFLDLDGDGVPEIVLIATGSRKKQGYFTVLYMNQDP